MNTIVFGDCREIMRTWKESGTKVQMCVTSPPYYALRDYAVDGQIGLEESPEAYIAAMVTVFRCVHDIMADDGTLWVNIGDTYHTGSIRHGTKQTMFKSDRRYPSHVNIKNLNNLKRKDLIGIPWMLAFALRTDGWYLRQDIIWNKLNCMPESVKDRCTNGHEYLFLLSKSSKYYFDSTAIAEPCIYESGNRNKRSVWSLNHQPYASSHSAVYPPALITPCILAGSRVGDVVLDPFMGSGTTAMVATSLDRKYIGCELNPKNEALQNDRINSVKSKIVDNLFY